MNEPTSTRARGQGRIFRRGPRWWIAYYAPTGGQSTEHREPAGDTEADAKRLLKDRLRALAVHQVGLRVFRGPRQEHVTMTSLLEIALADYHVRQIKSLHAVTSQAKHLTRFFTLDRALGVTPSRIRQYIWHRQQQGAAPASINRELCILRRAFRLAVDDGTLATSPRITELPEQNARQGFFERAAFETVVQQLGDDDLVDFVSWFYWTGMRPGEIRSLTWDGFDRETWTLRLHARNAKNGHGRALTLIGPLKAIIQRRLDQRRLDCPLVFHRNGRPVLEFRARWKHACKIAGVPGMLVYDLRRTAVRNMVRAGVDPTVAMRISGHKTREIFDRYNIINDDDVSDALQKTVAYVTGLP